MSTTAVNQVSQAEIQQAITTLVGAWWPALLPHLGKVFDPESDPNYNGCGCGGEDDDGDPYCNCHSSCSCPSCGHSRHAALRMCSHCRTKPTRLKVLAQGFHEDGSISLAADEGDPAATDIGYSRMGNSRQITMTATACGTICARAIIDKDKQYRAKFTPGSALSADRTFYQVENDRYTPDDYELPPPVAALRHELGSAAYWAGEHARAVSTGQETAGNYKLDAVQRYLASSLKAWLDITEGRLEPTDWSPAGEEEPA